VPATTWLAKEVHTKLCSMPQSWPMAYVLSSVVDQLRIKTNLGYSLEFHDYGTLPRYDVKARRFKDLRRKE